MIRANFRDDWREFVEAEAPNFGLRYSAASALEQNTIAFLNARREMCRAGPPGAFPVSGKDDLHSTAAISVSRRTGLDIEQNSASPAPCTFASGTT